MSELFLYHSVTKLIYADARLLDEQRWTDWLDLYTEDCVFWVPAFRMDGSYTEDPATELNMIYIEGRTGLEARVFRLQTEISLSSTPVPRTRHSVSMTMLDEVGTNEVRAFANWQVVWSNDVRGQQINAGSYHYVIRRTSGGMRIKQKKVLLLDPVIDGYFDFYAI